MGKRPIIKLDFLTYGLEGFGAEVGCAGLVTVGWVVLAELYNAIANFKDIKWKIKIFLY